MKVIFTCGGFGGPCEPRPGPGRLYAEAGSSGAGAVCGYPPTAWAGPGGKKAGYAFRGIPMGGFQRSWATAAWPQPALPVHADQIPQPGRAILRDFRPDLVVGTGGYASYPVVKCAAGMGIPTAVHESNMVPGLTTKMLEGSADRIMVGFEECRQHYRHPDKIVVTGTPVRGDFFDLTRSQAREKLGLTGGRPLIVSFWGSLGASHMNAHMEDFFRLEAAEGMPFHHIHGVGKKRLSAMTARLRADGLEDLAGLDVREYIYDMAPVMRAADLVICRAGASTISEITALATPAILVPSPYVTNNHQEKNARILEQHGGSVVLLGGRLRRSSVPGRLRYSP